MILLVPGLEALRRDSDDLALWSQLQDAIGHQLLFTV